MRSRVGSSPTKVKRSENDPLADEMSAPVLSSWRSASICVHWSVIPVECAGELLMRCGVSVVRAASIVKLRPPDVRRLPNSAAVAMPPFGASQRSPPRASSNVWLSFVPSGRSPPENTPPAPQSCSAELASHVSLPERARLVVACGRSTGPAWSGRMMTKPSVFQKSPPSDALVLPRRRLATPVV